MLVSNKAKFKASILVLEGLEGQKLGVRTVKVVRISGVMIWRERKRKTGMSWYAPPFPLRHLPVC